MPKQNEQRKVYIKDCWRHAALLLPDSVRRRPETLLCMACCQGYSLLLQQALLILQLPLSAVRLDEAQAHHVGRDSAHSHRQRLGRRHGFTCAEPADVGCASGLTDIADGAAGRGSSHRMLKVCVSPLHLLKKGCRLVGVVGGRDRPDISWRLLPHNQAPLDCIRSELPHLQ